jgi:hypothetical protein
MAKDHFAYVGAYRECIDEINQLKKEAWNIVMDPKTEYYTKIQALKELHNLSKTCTLLIRDLPFITNIAKFYDKDVLNSNIMIHYIQREHIQIIIIRRLIKIHLIKPIIINQKVQTIYLISTMLEIDKHQ